MSTNDGPLWQSKAQIGTCAIAKLRNKKEHM